MEALSAFGVGCMWVCIISSIYFSLNIHLARKSWKEGITGLNSVAELIWGTVIDLGCICTGLISTRICPRVRSSETYLIEVTFKSGKISTNALKL